MKTTNLIYISIGSNKGDRFLYLQQAIDAVYQQIGDIVDISRLYQTPSWGFESEDFYNACFSVRTFYTAEKVLFLLQGIEKNLGRVRSGGKGYEARVIDLDILFSSEGVFDSEKLKVPHPSMENRKFVLIPLADIAAEFIHPILGKRVKQLVQETSDTSVMKSVENVLENPKKKYPVHQCKHLAIEGAIGAGKTTLSRLIAQEFNAKLILERFAENPFLPRFYEDMERYAFPLEMSFLAERYQRLQEDIAQSDLFRDFVVSDYDVSKSLIFAKVTLQPEEYALYKKVFDIMYNQLPNPGLYIYLYQNTERLLDNIKKRGREYEQHIKKEYLSKINTGYLQFIKSQTQFRVQIIDISDRDFIHNREDYIWVLEQLMNSLP